MPACRFIVGLEFDRRCDLTAAHVFRRDVEAGRAWTAAAPRDRTRSLYDVIALGGVARLSDVALARKALRTGTLIADSELRGAA